MKKHIIKSLPFALLIGSVYASNYQDKEEIKTSPTVIKYQFQSKDFDDKQTDKFTIMANLSKIILDQTKFPTIAKKSQCSSWSSENKCATRTGTYITIGQDNLIVEYQNVKNEDGSITANMVESDIYNNLSFNIKVDTEEQESYVIAKITVPNIVDINSSSMMSLTRYKPLDKPEKLREELLKILNPTNITLTKYAVVSGEIDNQYNVDSVYGNLGRIMGKYDWAKFPHCDAIEKIMTLASSSKSIGTMDIAACKDDGKKLNEQQLQNLETFMEQYDITSEQIPSTYRYKLDKSYIPVNIQAYPYRNQSKASYKAFMPYTMNSNGGISLESNNIESMVKYIESTVNN